MLRQNIRDGLTDSKTQRIINLPQNRGIAIQDLEKQTIKQSAYPSEERAQNQNYFDKYQNPTCQSTLDLSSHTNDDSYTTGARNFANPNLKNGNRSMSNCFPDRRQRKEKEPDHFTGENVEWADYICHFEQVSMWNNWSENEKAAQLAMSLRGPAQRILGDLTRNQLSNYQSMISVLTQRFNPAERETAYRCEFRNRKRLSGESAADYGYALKRLATRAYPTVPVSLRESIVIEQYINGLGSAEIRRHVQFAHPTSVDRAISLAVEFEAFEGVQNHTPRKPRDIETQSVRALKTESNVSFDTGTCSSKLSELEKSIALLQSSVEKLAKREKPFRRSHDDTRKKPVKCYNCNEIGHISKYCPKSRNSELVSSPKGMTESGSDSKSVDLN